jgi:DNA topoisomerase II
MPPKKQRYVKMDPIQHVLTRPDMYVGSTRPKDVEDFVVVDEAYHIEKKTINISPAILRLFIEPLSNAIDNVARSKTSGVKMTKISISIDEETGETCFWNDGDIIPIEIHAEEKCYNHSMIFGQLLTGSNYDDEEDRLDISGKNGWGIKAVNVFSKSFTVEGVDPVNKKMFKQTWKNNMNEVGEPVVIASKQSKGYTKITYTPDFARFGLENYTPDILSLYKRYVVDCAMITKLNVTYNDEEIPVEILVDYAKLYSPVELSEYLFVKTSDCEIVLTPSNDFEAISFANGVCTPLGGTHVDAWSEAIFRPLIKKLNKKGKPQINIGDVKKFFRLFVVATVKKPEFDSQSKLRLEGPIIEAEIKKQHIATISKWSVMEKLEDVIRLKEMVVLKKTERKKRGHEHVEGLDPANNEGGTKGRECSLILVEGLSAKTYASEGIQEGAFGKKGRDWFGIMALRGKVLNCRNASPAVIAKNKVVTDIIKALGVQYGLDYTDDENFKKLRYGRILIITDADSDGIHISALIQNMFHALFPTLLKRDESFITAMQTPIVRVYGKPDKIFYDEQEYYKYVASLKGKKFEKKYYKGLGTSDENEVAETFAKKLVKFTDDDKCFDSMNKAFHKKYSDMRKTWLMSFDPNKTVLKWEGNEEEQLPITFSEFIDTELIKFSIENCSRSIPNLMDGLKQGHRKVLYTCFKHKNLKYKGKPMKVAQVAGLVAFDTAYHHGEQILYNTITGMANAYVGSNNIPLLFRGGQFGSRQEGGKDAANGRYIFTKLDVLTRHIFHPDDDVLLEYAEDDGKKVEPKYYVPIIPTILVNGIIVGIGTGWSCNVPCYNPIDLVNAIKVWLDHDGKVFSNDGEISTSLLPELKPWYRGHTGEMTHDGKRFVSWGKMERVKDKVKITELPVGCWTSDFTEKLEKMKEEKEISNYKNYSTPKVIDFTIIENKDGMECNENNLGLYTYIHTTNMVLFSPEGTLKKFDSIEEIIDSYCQIRYLFYTKRKNHKLNELEHELKVMGNKKRFLEEVRDGELKLFSLVKGKRQSRKTTDIVAELEEKGYDKDTREEVADVEEGGVSDDEAEGDGTLERDVASGKKKSGHGYEYLLRMQISSITAEKIEKLKRDIASRIEARDTLQATTEKDLWIRDLDAFIDAYTPWLDSIANEKVGKKTSQKVAQKASQKVASKKQK